MSEQANYRINISLHVLILFTFLTVLFFTYISKLEQESISDALNSAINDQIGGVLSKMNESLISKYIDWDIVDQLAKNLKEEAKGESEEVKSNHHRLLIIGISIITGLAVVFSSLYVYYYMKGTKIDIKKILIENAIVFSCVGVIEFLFFTKIASKYVPVTPDMLSDTILERVKYRLLAYLSDKN